MTTELRLFIPAARVDALYQVLATALDGVASGPPLRLARPVRLLRLEELRCLNLSLHGSGEHIRTPLVFPLLDTRQFNFAARTERPHLTPDVDWLILGGRPRQLAGLLREARGRFGSNCAVHAIAYQSLRGPLPQTARPGERSLTLYKSHKNFNQKTWSETCRQLLELPEERWGEVGISNTCDLFQIFEPSLNRLLPRPPRLILDLGCGLGQVARTLALRFPLARVIGLDASPEAITVANSAFGLPNLSFRVADLSDPLPFAPGDVDLIVSTNALPYARNQRKTARGLFGLLSPQGLVLNHCRSEESHLFWDFPNSALLPDNTQIFLADWMRPAMEAGFATEVCSIPLGTSSHFYKGDPFPLCAEAFESFAAPRRNKGPQPYSPLFSHVLLAHSRLAAPADTRSLPLAENHLERLDQVLQRVAEAPEEGQRAALIAWNVLAKALALNPEALDFLTACLPGSAPVLRFLFARTGGPGG